MRTLAIDVGGTGIKASVLDARGEFLVDRVRVDTPYPFSPKVLADVLSALVQRLPRFDRISVGFPGVVRDGKVVTAPHFGNEMWRGFDLGGALAKRFGRPTRVLNDADMQGLAVVEGKGLELVVTLGTGVGTALFRDGRLMPHIELAHHPLHLGKTYNEYLGDRARKRQGNTRWNRRARRVMETLRSLLHYDKVYIGGGNARHITFRLERGMRIVSDKAGILGGIALWRSGKSGARLL